MTVLALALVCWLVTTIVVESELFRPLREYVDLRADVAAGLLETRLYLDDVRTLDVPRDVFWRKTRYLVSCHLCAGTWIALALVAVVPVHVFGAGFLGWALGGLLVKAVAHLVLVAHKAGEAVAR